MSKTTATHAGIAKKRSGSKTDKVIALMQRKNGACLDDMVKATGWLPHTTHAALSGLRKKGYVITRAKNDGVSRYSIAGTSA